jgi:hypothetical protein
MSIATEIGGEEEAILFAFSFSSCFRKSCAMLASILHASKRPRPEHGRRLGGLDWIEITNHIANQQNTTPHT